MLAARRKYITEDEISTPHVQVYAYLLSLSVDADQLCGVRMILCAGLNVAVHHLSVLICTVHCLHAHTEQLQRGPSLLLIQTGSSAHVPRRPGTAGGALLICGQSKQYSRTF